MTCGRYRPPLFLIGFALLASTLAATSAGERPALAARPQQHVQPSGSSAIPWRRVGLGWAVAEYSATGARPGPTTLYVVSPGGRRYILYRWAPTPAGQPRYGVVDWSGDRRRVLLQDLTTPAAMSVRMEQISVATGRVISRFSLPRGSDPIGYTRPDGAGVLAVRFRSGTSQIVRYDLSGHLQQVLARGASSAIDAPDGRSVVVGTGYGLERVSDRGIVLSRMRAPVAVNSCAPVRWWNPVVVLTACYAKGSTSSRLWLFPVDGGAVTAITPQSGRGSTAAGYTAAWRNTSGVFAQALGRSCGAFVVRLVPNARPRHVVIPGTVDDDWIITASGSRLLVRAVAGACTGGASLLWFNPATHAVQYVLRAPSGVSGVQVVVPYGRPLA